MKIFMATLATETNTFSPIPSGLEAFTGLEFFRGDGSRMAPRFGNIPLIEWRRMAEGEGHAVVESLCTFAMPAGATQRAAFETLRDMILADLQSAGPMDLVLLFLHGAMVAEGYDDCEGDVISQVRAIVGPGVPVAVEIDLHCHLTQEMLAGADVIVIFKEYPHTDIAARARETYSLGTAAASGRIRPVMAAFDCRMVSLWRTTAEPMRSFVARMQALEGRDGILSVSFGHGFPWADVADVGAKVLVVADGDAGKAEALARALGQEVWAMRHQTLDSYDAVDAALDRAAGQKGAPIVLADVADNAGAGAPSDNTHILSRLVARGVTGVATGCYWDPVAVRFCQEAGVGATFDLRIGGKSGPSSGQPIDLRVTVRNVSASHSQASLSDGRADFGPSAWVSAQGIDIILTSQRQQTHSPDAFTGLGCTLSDKRLVVVKSMQHFHAGFAPIASEVRYVSATGAVPPEFGRIPYTKKTTPFWPRVDDPFAGTNQLAEGITGNAGAQP